tara:strand:- start:86 stop:700 length:615 start_codon:yes stop_codon:yes gene_type:complete
MKKLLELFAGTHSVGKVLKDQYYIVSVDRDLEDPNEISDLHIKEDILTWDYKQYPPGTFDVIWASPVCSWWSAMRFCWIGRKLKGMDRPLTREDIDSDVERYGIPMVDKLIEIIDYFNPTYYFIENPKTGRMKEYITYLPYYDVDYCEYGFDYRKRTRIWTNLEGFKPIICSHNKHLKDVCVDYSKMERYRIPPKLIENIFALV